MDMENNINLPADEDKEYVIFTDKTKDGREIELAVLEEFECQRKYYVTAALVEGDTINTENIFIYRLKLKGSVDYSIEKITDPSEYASVSKSYMEMSES